jgi:hypothetical protein
MSSSTPSQSRKGKHKRKRSASVASSSHQHLPPETINPLSHPPNLLKQFRVAGLPETERLPAVADFPHRPIPQHYLEKQAGDGDYEVYDDGEGDGDDTSTETCAETGTEAETDGELDPAKSQRKRAETRLKGVRRGRLARERNIGVLVGILRRCMAEGDMVLAKRAFGMLVRADIDGRRVDLRSEGYWGLGAEILMRTGERPSEGEEEDGQQNKKRWGSVQNMVLVRRFLEDLVQLHPYSRLHPESISALDFYPVLFSCEVYNIHVELEMALQRVEDENADDSYLNEHNMSPEMRLKAMKDELREGALEPMRDIAGRMDELMLNLPYSKSLEMLRIRAMVALFMGDLEVPASPRDEDEDETGRTKRDTERDRAVTLFKKILTGGGELEPWIRKLVAKHNKEDDDEDEDEEDETEIILPMFSSLPIR